jgi:hypothetical protein
MGLTPYIWGAASHQSLVPVYTEMQIQSSTPPIDIIMICHGSDGRYGCAADLQLTSSATSCTWLHLHPQRRPRRCRARTPDHQPIRPCPPFLRALAFAVSPASLPPPQPLLVEKAIPMLPPCPPPRSTSRPLRRACCCSQSSREPAPIRGRALAALFWVGVAGAADRSGSSCWRSTSASGCTCREGGGGDTMAVRSTSCASTSHLIYPSIRRQAAALGEAIRSAVAEGRSSSLVYFEAKGSDR